jgi:hypothetical protein
VGSLTVPLHQFEFGQSYAVYVSSDEDLVPVWLVDVTTALHALLVPEVESEFVLGVELPSSLLLR